jgi:hypothetical protein
MADAPTVRKKYAPAKYSDRLNPQASETPKISEKRKQLWQALCSYCQENGAWVIGVPGHREFIIHCRKDSVLPSKLAELGYEPRQCGATTRIAAGTWLPVDIVSFVLPGK